MHFTKEKGILSSKECNNYDKIPKNFQIGELSKVEVLKQITN